MTYTPTTWDTGDVITAQKMNNIEAGIQEASGCLVCDFGYNSALDENCLNKTVQEIYDAFVAGTPVYVRSIYGTLGPSGTGTYSANGLLVPVTFIYGYEYDSLIRICVSQPSPITGVTGATHVYSPGVWILQAGSMDDYPTSYKFIYVPAANIVVD